MHPVSGSVLAKNGRLGLVSECFILAPVHTLREMAVQKGRRGRCQVSPVRRSSTDKRNIQKQHGFAYVVAGCTLPDAGLLMLILEIDGFWGKQCPEIPPRILYTTAVAVLVQWSPATAVVEFR